MKKNPYYAKNPYFPSKKASRVCTPSRLGMGPNYYPFANVPTTWRQRVFGASASLLVDSLWVQLRSGKWFCRHAYQRVFLPEERDVECWTLRIHLADTVESSLASGFCSGQITLLTSADISLTAEFFFAFPNFVALTKHNFSADTLTLALVRWLENRSVFISCVFEDFEVHYNLL